MSIDVNRNSIRSWSILGSAGVFGVAALELPSICDDALILTADLRNFSGLDRFASEFPDRFINVGIAEQNMVGIAAALASEGYVPFATTYGTFASARSADAVRVNMGYMNLGVKLVGMASGLSVGLLGATHMGIEDVSFMRSIPNLTVISPADSLEAVKATLALSELEGPAYLRLGGGVPNDIVYSEDYEFTIGSGVPLRVGSDVALIATGPAVAKTLKAAMLLEKYSVDATVINMHTIKPLDEDLLSHIYLTHDEIFSVEEHTVLGGLGSAIAEHMAMEKRNCVLTRIGINDFFPHAADYGHLVEQSKLDSLGICSQVVQRLGLNHEGS